MCSQLESSSSEGTVFVAENSRWHFRVRGMIFEPYFLWVVMQLDAENHKTCHWKRDVGTI
jgi:hypothetical protein